METRTVGELLCEKLLKIDKKFKFALLTACWRD